MEGRKSGRRKVEKAKRRSRDQEIAPTAEEGSPLLIQFKSGFASQYSGKQPESCDSDNLTMEYLSYNDLIFVIRHWFVLVY